MLLSFTVNILGSYTSSILSFAWSVFELNVLKV